MVGPSLTNDWQGGRGTVDSRTVTSCRVAAPRIDKNASERDIKRLVLNRKKSLFVGNERGGETAAIPSSFSATRKRHGVDPQKHLRQAMVSVPRRGDARWLVGPSRFFTPNWFWRTYTKGCHVCVSLLPD